MSFFANYPPSGSGGSVVTSLNGMTGALTLIAGTGITITPGSGTLTIDAAGGGGATTALDNLAAVQINDDLVFGPATPGNIKTNDGTGASATEALTLTSGTVVDGVSGAVTLASGNALGIGASGVLTIATGTTTADVSGIISIATGAVSGNAPSGAVSIASGVASTNFSGAVTLSSGAGEAGSGNVSLLTGIGNSGNSGDILVSSGNSNAASSGNVSIASGLPASGADSGSLSLSTHDTDTAASGPISISSGIVTGNAASGAILIASGNADTNNSGNITLSPGTSPATRGQIRFQDGSEGTSGHIWTSTDVNGAGAWAALPSGGANVTLSNLTNPTAVNVDLTFDKVVSDTTLTTPPNSGLGLIITNGSNNSGNTAATKLFTGDCNQSASSSGSIIIATGTQASPGGGTGSVQISSGDVPSVASTSGNIRLATGTGGLRGSIILADGSEGTAGHVWTSLDTSGTGAWAAPTSGASTTLNNLGSTAVNVSISPGTTNSINVGTPSNQWAHVSNLRNTSDFSGESMLSGFLTSATASIPVSGMGMASIGTPTNNFYMITANSAVADATATQNINLVTGDKSAGTGDSGSITLAPGTSAGGVAGRIFLSAAIQLPSTVTPGGTVGDQTIDKPSGTVNIDTGNSSVTVTNSLVTTSSIVFAVVRTADASAYIKNVVPSSGSFVITLGAATTAEASIGFMVINQ